MRPAEVSIRVRRARKAPQARRPAGVWKIAYADFMTALMAFFLVMWLINTTSPDQKRGIADYFSSAAASTSPGDARGSLARGGPAPSSDRDSGAAAKIHAAVSEGADDPQLAEAARTIRGALEASPDIASLAGQVILAEDPRGLSVLLVDADGRPMFASGSAVPTARARRLLAAIAPAIVRLTRQIAITGHTSASSPAAAPASDWALSSARAEAARRLLVAAGVAPERVFEVAGEAASDPLYPDEPAAAGNRRVAIVLTREAPAFSARPG